ncbi:hypothetical protein J6590_097042, partial [Homalodisca vitripennis]
KEKGNEHVLGPTRATKSRFTNPWYPLWNADQGIDVTPPDRSRDIAIDWSNRLKTLINQKSKNLRAFYRNTCVDPLGDRGCRSSA